MPTGRTSRRGLDVVHRLGELDIGQAAVIQNGFVLGVEAAEGTDRLVERCAEFINPDAGGGVLVKAAKPTQDRRVDLPAVGISTVEHAARSGLAGIGVETGRTLIVERAAMIEAADRAGVFLVGVTSGD